MAFTRRSGSTSSALYRCGSPSALNAALCIAGEREWATGWPNKYTSLMRGADSGSRYFSSVPVFDAVRLLLFERLREGVVAGPVVLRHEVEELVRHRLRRALERCHARVADRRGRQPRDEIGVVGGVLLQIVERELAPVPARVLDRRVGIELHPDVEAVLVHASDRGALRAVARLALHDRRQLHEVVD